MKLNLFGKKKKKKKSKYTPDQFKAMEAIEMILSNRTMNRSGQPGAGVPRTDMDAMIGRTVKAGEQYDDSGRTTARIISKFDTPEGARYYPGVGSSRDPNLATQIAMMDAGQRSVATPADSLESYLVDTFLDMDSETLFTKKKKKK